MPENIYNKNSEEKYNFKSFINKRNIQTNPLEISTLQINITKLCNQTCVHCHVDASPKRKEQMELKTVEKCLDVLEKNSSIKNLDITGGAPELNPLFDYLVKEARKLNKHIIVRHNLTVTLDKHPVTGKSQKYLPEFFANNKVEVISSLPYYQKYFTDKQRGNGVFEKSIESILLLNKYGYGKEDTGLELNFVYNPVGAFLPPPQKNLEADFKRELSKEFGITFNKLFTITNMPINRFKKQLIRLGTYEDYMEKLVNTFNPKAVEGIMCRSLLSVSHDGKIYDCDFNQMLDLQISDNGSPSTIFDFDYKKLIERKIIFGSHCFGCTAGAGSSCGGNTT